MSAPNGKRNGSGWFCPICTTGRWVTFDGGTMCDRCGWAIRRRTIPQAVEDAKARHARECRARGLVNAPRSRAIVAHTGNQPMVEALNG